MMKRRKFLQLGAAAAASSAIPRTVNAQNYPSRPVTVVVPTGAGGPQDVIARVVTEHMRDSFGQPLIIENVPGANGRSGSVGWLALSPMATRLHSASHQRRMSSMRRCIHYRIT
jgi:tripartite-type tricarboxylate transporter receptor subunit TctC